MTACGDCVRMTGRGKQGESWICGDCRVGQTGFERASGGGEEGRRTPVRAGQNFEPNDKILNILAADSAATMKLRMHG